MQKMYTCLWFDKQAEEAANYYISVFKNGRILGVTHYGKEGFEFHKMQEGTVMTVDFEVNGQRFQALNGGPIFKFTEAISLVVECETQKEVDEYWDKLSTDGEKSACGWLKDKYGLSWQIVPSALIKMMQNKDRQKTERVMKAMLTMSKLDIAALDRAFDGR